MTVEELKTLLNKLPISSYDDNLYIKVLDKDLSAVFNIDDIVLGFDDDGKEIALIIFNE